MKGRIENTLKIEKYIEYLLLSMPECVSDYYYSISVSKEPKTCEEYLKKIRTFISFLGKDNFSLNKITSANISRFLHSIETTNNGNEIKNTSFSYRKGMYSAINSFVTYLYKANLINSNPMLVIERPKNEDHITRDKYTTTDLAYILQAVDSGTNNPIAKSKQLEWKSRDKAILSLLITTGIRETALSEINVEDLNMVTRELFVIDKRHKYHTYLLSKELIELINLWLIDREKFLNGNKCDALFISNRKSRINAKSISEIVKKYSYVGIGKKISPHKIRGAFCTILYEETGDIEFVKNAVGHSNIATTQRYISTDNREIKQKSMNIMSGLINY